MDLLPAAGRIDGSESRKNSGCFRIGKSAKRQIPAEREQPFRAKRLELTGSCEPSCRLPFRGYCRGIGRCSAIVGEAEYRDRGCEVEGPFAFSAYRRGS